jgi:hypothetical protein
MFTHQKRKILVKTSYTVRIVYDSGNLLYFYTRMSYCGTAYVQYGADEGSWGVRWVSLHTGFRSLLKPL